MIQFESLGHLNIVVDDMDSAIEFYQRIFNAIPHQSFPHFKNKGFAKSAGFLAEPEKIDVTITFLEIPNTGVFLELMEYHNPIGEQKITYKRTHDVGGVRHVALKVQNIMKAFDFLKAQQGVTMINTSADYQPFKIDEISADDFYFFDSKIERDSDEKQAVCDIISQIRYFYFIDQYGIQWELEQGHSDIGN